METKRYGKLLSRTCRNNRNLRYFLLGGQNFADKTAPIWGSRNGPQNGSHSFSLNLICLCPGGLAPVLGSVSGPQNGDRFCRQNLSRRAKNSESFDCFRGRATKVLHTAGRSMVLQRRERLFSCSPHPANFYVHACSCKNMCGHKSSQGVENMLAALQNPGNQEVWKTSVTYLQKQSKRALFFARWQKFCRQNGPHFGVQKRTP